MLYLLSAVKRALQRGAARGRTRNAAHSQRNTQERTMQVKPVDATQVLLDLRASLNITHSFLVDSVMDLCSENTADAQQVLSTLDRDTVVAIAHRLDISTESVFGYTRTPVSTSDLIQQIAEHYAAHA